MELCKKLIDTIEPVYGDISNENFPGHTQALDLKLRLPDIHWGLILGKPYIDMFTKEKILSCPCYKITELNSNVLIETTDSVYQEISNEVREKIKYHLGEYEYSSESSEAQPTSITVFKNCDGQFTGPRGMRIGNTFAQTLSKFPQEKNWETNDASSEVRVIAKKQVRIIYLICASKQKL